MHWLDIATICVLVGSFIYSLTKGLVRELFSLGSAILAVILAIRFCSLGHRFLGSFIDTPNLNNVLGFITIFILVTYLGSLTGRLVRKFIKSAGISPTDRFWGGVLGLIKGGVIVSSALLLTTLFLAQGPKMIAHTRIARLFNPITRQLSHLLPPILSRQFRRRFNKTSRPPSFLEKAALESDKNKLKQIIEDNL